MREFLEHTLLDANVVLESLDAGVALIDLPPELRTIQVIGGIPFQATIYAANSNWTGGTSARARISASSYYPGRSTAPAALGVLGHFENLAQHTVPGVLESDSRRKQRSGAVLSQPGWGVQCPGLPAARATTPSASCLG